MNVESHEAGHALAAALAGHEIEYVTVVADKQGAGHVSAKDPAYWWNTPAWLDFGIVTAAGMAGEAAAHARHFTATPSVGTVYYVRAVSAQGGGTGSQPVYDTATLRWIARTVWTTAQELGPAVLGPEFNPAWAADPDGVQDIAAYCWEKAVRLVCEHAGSLTRIAKALRKHKTLTGEQVTNLIGRRPRRRPINPDLVGTDFWLADYSRLVWRPQGMCRPTTTRNQLAGRR